jgi:MoaA/NifB/PqqE/SkfB family radical SAM enzyme
MADCDRGILGIIKDLAFRSKVISDQPLCVVGSAAHMLNGAAVLPRDLDLVLPAGVSSAAFADLILRPSGYIYLGDFCWQHRAAHEDRLSYPIDLSDPMERIDPNLFYSCPEHRMSWDFDNRFLKIVDVGGGQSVAIPNESLAIVLLLKSISDKVLMIPALAQPDADFWNELLINDIKNLRVLIPLYESVLVLEDMQDVIQLLPNTAAVRSQVLTGCEFARRATAAVQPDLEPQLRRLAGLLRNYFDLPLSLPQSGALPALKALQTNHTEALYSCEMTGAIYIDATDKPEDEPLSLPLFVDIQLNASCNLSCAHCDYVMDGRTLPLVVLREKLGDMAKAGVQQVNFGEGSEALLYRDLPKAIRMASDVNLTPNLTTNLTFQPSQDLMDAIRDCCGAVATSIDRFHFQGFPRDMTSHPLTQRIRALVEADVFVILNTVYDRDDTEGVASVLAYAEGLGCDAVCLIRRFYDKGTSYRKLPLRDFGLLLDQIEAHRESSLHVGFHTCDPVLALLRPPEGPRENWMPPLMTDARHTLFLDADGAYRPTSFAPEEERVFGTLCDAWRSDVFNRYRARSAGAMKLV